MGQDAVTCFCMLAVAVRFKLVLARLALDFLTRLVRVDVHTSCPVLVFGLSFVGVVEVSRLPLTAWRTPL